MTYFIDIDSLRAFSIVATELNMRRAAEQLNISQPPLSRKIKNLEDSMGLRLFIRRSYGLELTEDGKKLLEIVQPLLKMQEDVQRKLDNFKKSGTCRVGFSTAFEQSVYEPISASLSSLYGRDHVMIKRATSLQLANDVLKGHLQAAWIALPINKPEVSTLNIGYAERLMAVLPETWKGYTSPINLYELNGLPFFWFPASRNPAWHEAMNKVFRQLGFWPDYVEEPLEYEVLLARIAAGEGWALIPESFTAIQRKGVELKNVRDLPPLAMGIIYNKAGEIIADKCGDALKKVD